MTARKARTRSMMTLGIFLTAAFAVAGCSGGTADTNDSSGAPSGSADSECGTVPELGANDPDGLLDPSVAANFNGYPVEVQASVWSDWAPEGAGPYTAAIVSPPPTNPYIAQLYDGLRASLEEADVEIIADFAVAENSDVPGQLQQFSEAVAAGPDIIFFTTLAPAPAIEAVAEAAAAGIPVVGVEVPIESPNAVSVARNSVLQAMDAGASIVDSMGGEGSILRVIGIPGIATDTLAWVGYDAVLGLCPDITVAGEVTGNFVPATAQAETLKFLSTNPAGVDGVLQAGTMGYAILQAFEDSGLEPAPISDIGSTMGFINWAADNPDYPYIGSATPAAYMGQINAEVGLRILAGEGPKVNLLVGAAEMIDAEQAAGLADPSANPGALVVGDPSNATYPEGELDVYFNNPGQVK